MNRFWETLCECICAAAEFFGWWVAILIVWYNLGAQLNAKHALLSLLCALVGFIGIRILHNRL